MLRQLLVASVMLMICGVTYAEDPHFVRTTDWTRTGEAAQWFAYYGERDTDNVVRIYVRKIGNDVFFETNDECPMKGLEGMKWKNGQESAVFTKCDGEPVTVNNLPALQGHWEPFPPEIEAVLKEPSDNSKAGPALLAGQAEGS